MTEYEQREQRVSREDVDSVSRKLESLAADLPESERAVLGLVLSRAQAAPQDVDLRTTDQATAGQQTAARFERPFAGQLARAAGLFARKPEVTVIVGWQFAFAQSEATPE